MNRNRMQHLLGLGAMAALAAAPMARAAEAEVKADVNLPKAEVKVDRNRTTEDANTHVVTNAAEIRARGIQKANKASGLLGMEVRNYQNEKLGEIKDLVMDLNSGRISYAVLAVGGFLGIGEKLIALPPSALAISDDRSFLKLDADKAKIEAAPGFAATNWPRPDDPEFRSSRLWLKDSASGAPAGIETRSARGATDRDRGVRSEVNVNTDSRERLYTDAKETRGEANLQARTDVSATRDYERVHGVIKSVDSKHNEITVQTDGGDTRTFAVNDQANLRLGKLKTVRLNDFKPGYDVTIDYDKSVGKWTAYTIEKSDNP
jgi:hypothetical protein